MALKTLFSDLTAGVNAYPNHNTPSTAGGFNYGKSYTPVFEGVFRQTSFKFGEGKATDRHLEIIVKNLIYIMVY